MDQGQLLRDDSEFFANSDANKRLIKGSSYFISIIHDLKSPISCLQAMIDYLENSIKDNEKKSDILDNVKDIKEVNEELKDIVNNYLDVNVDNSYFEQNITLSHQVNISDICSKIVKMHDSFAYSKNITIISNIEKNLIFDGIYVKGLKRVLANLLSNAIKYSHNSSKVEISAKKQDKKLNIIIKDQGCGITKNDLADIIDDEVTLDKTKSVSDSHGIGLGIVKYLVESMKGEITINSKVGVGTEFNLVFGS